MHIDKILSIIVPSYNMEAYLPKCLGSLIIDDRELLQKLDVIVVNDGSKDRTSEIAHEFEAKYPGVFRVIDKPNGNYGSCINAALPTVKGEYIKVLDADDWFDTSNLSEYLVWLSEVANVRFGGCDLIFTDYDCFDESGRDTGKIRQGLPEGCVFDISNVVQREDIYFMHGYTYRTALIKGMNYRQTEGISYTDMEWIFAPAVRAQKLAYFPKVIYNYLFGRAGQTVDPIVQARSMDSYKKLINSLLNTYEKEAPLASEYGRNYLMRHLRRLLQLIYGWYFINAGKEAFIKDLPFFENELKKKCPQLYLEMDEWRCPNRFGVMAVKAWRASPSFNSVVLPRIINFICKTIKRMFASVK